MHSHECWMGFSGFLQHSPPALNSSSIILFKLLIGIAIGRGSDLNGSTLSKPYRIRDCSHMSTYRFGPSETRYLLCHNNIIICRPRYQMYLYDIINGYLFLIQMGNHELHSQSNTEAYTSTKQTVKVVFQESMNTLQYLSIIYKEVFLSFGVLHHRSQS